MSTPEELLDQVRDRESFVAFVEALSTERAKAESLERDESVRYMLGGAMNWQNGDISSYLGACLYGLSNYRTDEPNTEPSWQLFAEFLYWGKIME